VENKAVENTVRYFAERININKNKQTNKQKQQKTTAR